MGALAVATTPQSKMISTVISSNANFTSSLKRPLDFLSENQSKSGKCPLIMTTLVWLLPNYLPYSDRFERFVFCRRNLSRLYGRAIRVLSVLRPSYAIPQAAHLPSAAALPRRCADQALTASSSARSSSAFSTICTPHHSCSGASPFQSTPRRVLQSSSRFFFNRTQKSPPRHRRSDSLSQATGKAKTINDAPQHTILRWSSAFKKTIPSLLVPRLCRAIMQTALTISSAIFNPLPTSTGSHHAP